MNKELKWWSVRFVWLIFLPPIAGITCGVFLDWFEGIFRDLTNQLSLEGSSSVASEAFNRAFLVIYIVLCWFLIEPLSVISALVLSVEDRAHPVLAATITASIFWLISSLIFHRPEFDQFLMTIFAMGMVVGLPVFFSALATTYAITPNNSSKRTESTRSA